MAKKVNNGQDIKRPSWFFRFDIIPRILCLLLALLLWLVVVNTVGRFRDTHYAVDPAPAAAVREV